MSKAREDLQTILELAMDWCKENDKSYLNLSVIEGRGLTNVTSTDSDYDEFDIYLKGEN